MNKEEIVKDFPILDRKVNGKKLVYFDNAATTQKPLSVINAISDYYKIYNANPHRGAHTLSVEATEAYEQTRNKVAKFINARSEQEIIFTKNTTEALNLVAYSYVNNNLTSDDEITICITEHHSNLIPWQQIAIRKGAKINYMYVDSDGILSVDEIKNKITDKTKVVCIAHVTNTFGIVNPVEEIVSIAHEKGAIVVIDGAQSTPHMKIDVQKLDADFFAFSGHKMLAPMGVGVLYGKKELLKNMTPFLYGGDMIEYVSEQTTTFAELPFKFEAGTQNVEAVVGLSSAIDYIEKIGYEYIEEQERELTEYALEKLNQIDDVIIYGSKNIENKVGVISFNVKDVHPHDTATILDRYGIAIRSGHHCAQPFMKHLDLNSTCRISFYFYNTKEEIDIFIDAIKKVRGHMGYGTK
ncbi:MAG: cysteine desulfurase [Clostridia bacterium]|nr:cysteine desulfurase [Clostridia bacterium]